MMSVTQRRGIGAAAAGLCALFLGSVWSSGVHAQNPAPYAPAPMKSGLNALPQRGPVPAREALPQPMRTMPVPFRDTEYGQMIHLGDGDSPGRGYPHFDSAYRRYGIWYRPRSFGWDVAERCAPRPFRPRGYGNLFNETSMCHRMDYHRFEIRNYRSEYGPSYYQKLPTEQCFDCDHSDKYRPRCETRTTEVWTLKGLKPRR